MIVPGDQVMITIMPALRATRPASFWLPCGFNSRKYEYGRGLVISMKDERLLVLVGHTPCEFEHDAAAYMGSTVIIYRGWDRA
jgi:hypothetical protein